MSVRTTYCYWDRESVCAENTHDSHRSSARISRDINSKATGSHTGTQKRPRHTPHPTGVMSRVRPPTCQPPGYPPGLAVARPSPHTTRPHAGAHLRLLSRRSLSRLQLRLRLRLLDGLSRRRLSFLLSRLRLRLRLRLPSFSFLGSSFSFHPLSHPRRSGHHGALMEKFGEATRTEHNTPPNCPLGTLLVKCFAASLGGHLAAMSSSL